VIKNVIALFGGFGVGSFLKEFKYIILLVLSKYYYVKIIFTVAKQVFIEE
jgi:hypothetical protein